MDRASVPMQGPIVEVLVEVGQAVEAGQSGTVTAANVKPGNKVAAGDIAVFG